MSDNVNPFQPKTSEGVRREIDRAVKWQSEGIHDGSGTGCDAVHACAAANRPEEILYFLKVAPQDAVSAAADYLERLRANCDFLIHPYVGRIEPERSQKIREALQPVYRQIHHLLSAALAECRRSENCPE